MAKKTMQLPDDLPTSRYIQPYACTDPDCGIHLVLFSENDEPIAQAPMDLDTVRRLIAALQDIIADEGEPTEH